MQKGRLLWVLLWALAARICEFALMAEKKQLHYIQHGVLIGVMLPQVTRSIMQQYYYTWTSDAKRMSLKFDDDGKRRTCTIDARLRNGMVLVRFVDNGQTEVIDPLALVKAT